MDLQTRGKFDIALELAFRMPVGRDRDESLAALLHDYLKLPGDIDFVLARKCADTISGLNLRQFAYAELLKAEEKQRSQNAPKISGPARTLVPAPAAQPPAPTPTPAGAVPSSYPLLEQFEEHERRIDRELVLKFFNLNPSILKVIAIIEIDGSNVHNVPGSPAAKIKLLREICAQGLSGHYPYSPAIFNEALAEMIQIYTLPTNEKIIPDCRYFQSKITNHLLIWGLRLHSDVKKALSERYLEGVSFAEPYAGPELIVRLSGRRGFINPYNEQKFEAFLTKEGFDDVVKSKYWQ